MGLLQRSRLVPRVLGIVLGVACVAALGLPAAWPTVAADDRSSLGTGIYPGAYAIAGAKIVTAPGKTLDPGTIVVRRGLIEAVGLTKDVTVPYDAETIDGKGLVVYPGFIDMYTTIGQRGGRAVGDRQGPAGGPGRGSLDHDAPRQPQGIDSRI